MLTSVRREDHGIYQCFAGNDGDSAQAAAQIMIGGKQKTVTEFPGRYFFFNSRFMNLVVYAF